MTNKTENVEVVGQEQVSNTEVMDIAKADQLSPSMFNDDNQSDNFFSSIVNDGSRESQVAMYSAINDAEQSLSDHLGEVLEIEHMVAHTIELEDEMTKEMQQAMRVVLVTSDGQGYHSVSQGVVSSIQKLIATVGQAPWTPPLKVVPVEKKTRKGFKTLTLKLQA